jgi:predicted dithiol-disulfide oxidoreductase (DUF899 family)
MAQEVTKSSGEIEEVEKQIFELTQRLAKLRKQERGAEVPEYRFGTLSGEVSLLDLFAGRDVLFAIHNMGQACRYCTLWADGLNAFLPHLEDGFAVVLLSKDPPDVQRRFANSRGWRFRMASHGGGAYIQEQTAAPGGENVPGIVCYVREGDRVRRKNSAVFGPGDLYCSIWNVLALAGLGEEEWTPQYAYWKRPAASAMEDGGANLR